jgi:hypothetical protein
VLLVDAYLMRIMLQRSGGLSEQASREALNWEGLWICEAGKVAGVVESALRAEARRVEKSVTEQRHGLTRSVTNRIIIQFT